MKTILQFTVVFILLFSCAKQGFPPGGPVDRKPPSIIRTNPANNSTNVPQDTRVEIYFSEAVERRSCERSLFITPFAGENVKYKWRGKRLRIEFADSLLKNRTYVITIGAGTKDMRNNAMKESFSLAFSTGAELDMGKIKGMVFGDGQVGGTQVWAYDLAEMPQPDPSQLPPIYVTQAGEDGRFSLSHLANSTYRLFAVLDRDGNNLYDVEYDFLGVTSKDVSLSEASPIVSEVNFVIALRDTTRPELEDAAASDNRHVLLRFSEPMSPQALNQVNNFSIQSQKDSLRIIASFPDERNFAYVHLTTETQTAENQYRVAVKEAFDLSGLGLNPDSSSAVFQGSAVPDSTKPQFLFMIPKDSAQFVPLKSNIEIVFSEAMNTLSVERHLVVADTLGDTISGNMKWQTEAHLNFQPQKGLKGETLYFITLPVDSIFDLSGNALKDTLFEKRFVTVNPDTLSEISGSISDADSTAQGAFHIKAKSDKGQEYQVWVEKEKAYHFFNILPGIYTLELFRDTDSNRKYSLGEAFPFIPAERFYLYPDSISVRSRWPNEGNDIVLPK
ncbi:MAG: Ig-like domain-containing protein [Calditrichaeota bacterium]|nr:Ig-like domain-containing protein [Calditrichota bacterium]